MRLLSSQLSEVGAFLLFLLGLSLGAHRLGFVGSLLVTMQSLKMRAIRLTAGPREMGANVQCLDHIMPENDSGHLFS